jgi:hypothetical protein
MSAADPVDLLDSDDDDDDDDVGVIPDPRSLPNLTDQMILEFCGDDSASKSCGSITSLHLQQTSLTAVEVVARIEAASTNQGHYEINLRLDPSSGSPVIVSGNCSCPVGEDCKHIYKVLRRIRHHVPISQAHLQRVAKRRKQATASSRGCYVYIVMKSQSERDSGSDYHAPAHLKENFGVVILGTFLNIRAANKRAKEVMIEEFVDEDEEEDEEDEEDDEDISPFMWDDEDNYNEDVFNRIWVEEQALEDASPQFHM